MQDANALLRSFHQRGIEVESEGKELRLQGNTEALSHEDIEIFGALKADLLGLFDQMDLSKNCSIPRRRTEGSAPLSPLQLYVWNRVTTEGRGLSYRFDHHAMRVIGILDVSLLKASVDFAASRHESLRTRFDVIDGAPRQMIDEKCAYEWRVVDVSHLTVATIETELVTLISKFVTSVIDVRTDSLFSVRLFKLSDCDHMLIFALDHLITDFVSNGILINEVWTCYVRGKRGLEFSLPKPGLQFADYSVWLEETHGAWLHKHERYWRDRIFGSPTVEIPVSGTRIEMTHPVGARFHTLLGLQVSSKLREIARLEKTLLPIAVLTVYVAVMSFWCKQRDLVIAFVTNGRCRSGLRSVVGYLAHELHLRVAITKADTFLDLMAKLKYEFYAAYKHTSFGRIYSLVPGLTNEIWFDWIPDQGTQLIADCQLDERSDMMTVTSIPTPVALPLKLIPLFYDTGSVIRIKLDYRPDLVSEKAIRWCAETLTFFADYFVRNPRSEVETLLQRFSRNDLSSIHTDQ